MDSERRALHLTQDRPNGGLCRFRPDRWADLSSGRLDVLAWTPNGVWWAPVPDLSGAVTFSHLRRGNIFRCNGAEGIWYAGGMVYFTTKGDGWVWRLELTSSASGWSTTRNGTQPAADRRRSTRRHPLGRSGGGRGRR